MYVRGYVSGLDPIIGEAEITGVLIDIKIRKEDTSGNVLFVKNKTAGKIRWELMNIQGQIVEKSYEDGADIEVNLCGLSSGIYFLNVIIGDKQAGRKIVVR